MNELKPEDVMMALECCANRSCEGCPFERPNEDCVSGLPKAAVALLREKDAGIAMMAECIERQDKELAKKGAEIERLKNSITFQVVMPDEKMEEIKAECLKRVELDIKAIKAEAITEFFDRVCKEVAQTPNANEFFINAWKEKIEEIAKEMKGEKDGRKEI